MNNKSTIVRAILMDASECERPDAEHPAAIEISAEDLQRILERHITAAPQATPFMWAIQEPGGGAYMDDGCVSSVREDVQAEVDGLNSGLDADDDPYQVVPVYLAAAPQAVQAAVPLPLLVRDIARDLGISVPHGYKITEEMHVAAVKVLHRASGVDGLPQRMLDAMLAAAPQPPEATTSAHSRPVCGAAPKVEPSAVSNGSWPDAPPQENIRDGAPYDDPEFEKLGREHAVWGTAQSALCAQFWLAALEQRAPLTKEEISEIMKLVGKYGTAVEANSTGNPSDYTLALEEARAFDAVRFRLLTIERNDGIEAQGNSQQT